jgi:hypothetical protein
MKVAFPDQLVDELRYQGCDLAALLQKGEPNAKRAEAPDETWPAPGTPGAPGTPLGPVREPPSEKVPSNLPTERVTLNPIPMPKRAPEPPPTRTGILFYVDNTKCKRDSAVFLDGKSLGKVPSGTRSGFQSQAGPHDLCLLDNGAHKCGDPGTVRRSYLHEGWTITLRCD